MLISIIKVILAFIISLCFGVMMEVPRKFLLHISVISAIGRLIYILFTENGYSEVVSTFAATFAIAILSHSLARMVKAPVTVFLITGILPLVPGMGMYQMVNYFLRDERSNSLDAAISTFMIAGSIALAIFLVDSVFKLIKYKHRFKI